MSHHTDSPANRAVDGASRAVSQHMTQLRSLRTQGVVLLLSTGIVMCAVAFLPLMAVAEESHSESVSVPYSIVWTIMATLLSIVGLLAWSWRLMFTQLLRAIDKTQTTSRPHREHDK